MIPNFKDFSVRKKMDSLNSLKFSKETEKDHLDRIERANQISNSPRSKDPVKRSELADEVLKIKAYIQSIGNKEAIKSAGEYDKGMIDKFLGLSESLGIKGISRDKISDLMKKTGDIILKEKYKWNIPRPFQVANLLDIPFEEVYETDTTRSPSYPSGHSAQAHSIAKFIGNHRPDAYPYLESLADSISLSRVAGGVHYFPDIKEGKRLGSIIGDRYYHSDL